MNEEDKVVKDITHINPNCKDATRCKLHSERGSVTYDLPPLDFAEPERKRILDIIRNYQDEHWKELRTNEVCSNILKLIEHTDDFVIATRYKDEPIQTNKPLPPLPEEIDLIKASESAAARDAYSLTYINAIIRYLKARE